MNNVLNALVIATPAFGLMTSRDADYDISDQLTCKDEIIESLEHYEEIIDEQQDRIDYLEDKLRDSGISTYLSKPKNSSAFFDMTPMMGGHLAGCIAGAVMHQLFKANQNDSRN